MSVARGFGINGKSYYNNLCKPSDINLSFVVNSADSAGFGITGLKSNGYVNNVFMHTSGTPGLNNGLTNPNPLAGYALIQLKQNFNVFINGVAGYISKNSGSDIKIDNSAMTVGQVYTITTLGNATAAKWLAIGVPAGITPAVGVSFVALTNGGAGNVLTSKVQIPSVSGVTGMEIIGNPNVMVNTNVGSSAGQMVLVQFLAPSFAGSAMTAHTHDFTVIGGQIASTTNDIANYAGPLLGKQEAANATYLGANSATNGGVVAASAGTPAGTMSLVVAAPVDGSSVFMKLRFDGSSVTVDGL